MLHPLRVCDLFPQIFLALAPLFPPLHFFSLSLSQSSPEDMFLLTFFFFLERRERGGGERVRNIHWLPPTRDSNLQPRNVPWLRIKPTACWGTGRCSSQPATQPGCPAIRWVTGARVLFPPGSPLSRNLSDSAGVKMPGRCPADPSLHHPTLAGGMSVASPPVPSPRSQPCFQKRPSR